MQDNLLMRKILFNKSCFKKSCFKKHWSLNFGLCSLGALALACGGNSGGVLDADAVSEIAAASIEDVSDSISDLGAGPGATTGLVGVNSITHQKTCTENEDGTATVLMTYSGSNEVSVGGQRGPSRSVGTSRSVSTSMSGTESRVWSRGDEIGVYCHTNEQQVEIDWSALAEAQQEPLLTMVATVARTRNVSVSGTRPNGSEFSMSRDMSVSGTRNVQFTSFSNEDTELTVRRNVILNLQRSMNSTSPKGVQKERTQTVTTKEGAPLDISVLRNTYHQQAISRTIHSGTVVVTDGERRIELEHSNVVFSDSGTYKCVPSSGTITVKVYDAGGSEPSSTYTVSFSSGSVTLTDSSGNETELEVSQSCDLQQSGS